MQRGWVTIDFAEAVCRALFSFISRGQSILNARRTRRKPRKQRGYRRYRGGKASPLYKRKTEETTRLLRWLRRQRLFLNPIPPVPSTTLPTVPRSCRKSLLDEETRLPSAHQPLLSLCKYICICIYYSVLIYSMYRYSPALEEQPSKRIPLEV